MRETALSVLFLVVVMAGLAWGGLLSLDRTAMIHWCDPETIRADLCGPDATPEGVDHE